MDVREEEAGVLRPDPDDPSLDLFPLHLALRELNMSERTFQRLWARGEIAKVPHVGKTYVQRGAIRSYFARRAADAEVERVKRERGKN